jgi:hypothetical protein
MKNKVLLFIIPLLLTFSGYSQSPAAWFELGFSKELVKNLKVEFNPELRLLGDYKMDSYIIEGGLSYKVHKYLTLASYYRYEDTYDYKKSTGAYKGQLKSNRIAFDVKSGIELSRFNFQVRIRYTNGLYENNDVSEFRYRAKIDYDIKGSKFVPFASVELFHDKSISELDKELISGALKDIYKIRYTAGLEYTINKNNDVSLFYRLQNNRIKDSFTNIIGLGYNHDF